MPRPGYVYLMASRRNGTLYLGVTSNLPKRAYEHRNGLVAGFSRRYGCKLLGTRPTTTYRTPAFASPK
jgi:putative endonuclease